VSGWNNQGDGGGSQQHPRQEFTEQEQYAYFYQQYREAFENGGLNAANPQNLGFWNMAYPGRPSPWL
jgi:hypothetical protein